MNDMRYQVDEAYFKQFIAMREEKEKNMFTTFNYIPLTNRSPLVNVAAKITVEIADYEFDAIKENAMARGMDFDEYIQVMLLTPPAHVDSAPRYCFKTKEHCFTERLSEVIGIKQVIFNDPATIVYWKDGTKTVVKKGRHDKKFDPEKGLSMCISKKILGNKGNYYETFKKFIGGVR